MSVGPECERDRLSLAFADLLKLVEELLEELVLKCDAPIHREQLTQVKELRAEI